MKLLVAMLLATMLDPVVIVAGIVTGFVHRRGGWKPAIATCLGLALAITLLVISLREIRHPGGLEVALFLMRSAAVAAWAFISQAIARAVERRQFKDPRPDNDLQA